MNESAEKTASAHKSVLLQESVDGLAIEAGDIIVDGTVGGGGHSEEILKRWGGQVRLICLDADGDALDRAKARLKVFSEANIAFVENNFRQLASVLDSLGIAQVNKVLLDLGMSSDQLERSGRGFSFQNPDEPLNMAFARTPVATSSAEATEVSSPAIVTAWTIVNAWSGETIKTILTGYGEERYAKQIAEAIVEARSKKAGGQPIMTVGQLVGIVIAATPKSYHRRRIHPATKTFQALRIAVNDESRALTEGLTAAWDRLAPGGRIAVISFHSAEDRIVKRFFREKVTNVTDTSSAELFTKKPIVAERPEMLKNPRARSAKLRILMKGK